jgi:hypothetical protein
MSSSSWWVNGDYFRMAKHSQYKPGTVSFALAWFQQGMVVSNTNYVVIIELRTFLVREYSTWK